MGKDTCHYFQPFLKVCSKLSFISVSFQKEFDKPVLVCLNFCIKIIPLGSLWTTEIYFSRFQRLKSPRSTDQQVRCPERSTSWFIDVIFSLAVSSCSKRGEGGIWGVFYKTPMPFMRLYLHDLITSQRPHLSVLWHWGLGFDMDFGGDIGIQFVA